MSASTDGTADDIESTWTWPEAIEEDTAEISSSALFRADSPFWSGNFLPPPPRPPYLEDQISTDGLTTCDLCSWALERYSESKPQTSGIGFTFSYNLFVTLTIVSLLSALLGAVIMIVLLNCRSRFGSAGSQRTFFCLGRRRCTRSSMSIASNNISLQTNKDVDHERSSGDNAKLRLSWLMLNRNRRPTPVQLLTTSVKSTPATNHYTVEETYTSINEVVYTELDRIPSPAYQNSGYILEADNDLISSAPSSAYYSDISAHGAYEMVGQTAVWNSENIRALRRLPSHGVRHSSSLPEDESVQNYI